LQPISAPETLHQRIMQSLEELEARQESTRRGLFGRLAVATLALAFISYAGVAYYDTRRQISELSSQVRGIADSRKNSESSYGFDASLAELLRSGQDVIFLTGRYASEGVSFDRIHSMLSGELELSRQTRFISVRESSETLIKRLRTYFEATGITIIKEYAGTNDALVLQAALPSSNTSMPSASFKVILLN
jgi:hypothetical protein